MSIRCLVLLCSVLAMPALAKDGVWNAAVAPVMGKEVRISDGETFVIRGTNVDLRITAPIIGPKGTIRGAFGSPGSVVYKAVLSAPVDVGTFLWGCDYAESPLEIAAAGNRWKRFELAFAGVVCKAANVLAPEGVLTWGGYYRGDLDRCATYDLGGFDQTVDRLESTSSPQGKNSDHIISSGGTLTLRGTADATCLARIDGGLSLVWAPKGDFRQTFDERENEMRGKLSVRRGTFCIGSKGTFRSVQEIEVADGAIFECQSTQRRALASVRTVRLGKNARLKVSGANPFTPGVVTVIGRPGAKVESEMQLGIRQVEVDETPPQEIGDKLQVFWDDQIVDRSETTASRVPHRPEFAGTVTKLDKPWEGDAGSSGTSVVKVGDTWRMYRDVWAFPETMPYYSNWYMGLFESKDGIDWKRAKVNRYTVCGEKENNVITDPDVAMWAFMVFGDANPSCPAAERFKAIVFLEKQNWSEEFVKKHPEYEGLAKSGRSLWCFVSADGIEFKPGWKLFGFGEYGLAFDSLNVAFWDAEKKTYRLYMRGSAKLRQNRTGMREGGRWVKVSESTDFRNWSKPVDISFADDLEDYQLYTNCIDQYPRNPELLVGFPTRYTERKEWTDNYDKLCDAERRRERMGNEPRHGLAITDCMFMWSRDGRVFHREEDAFLTPGPEHQRNWSYGSCYPQRGIVVSPGRRGDDPELSFYVSIGSWSGSHLELDRYALRMDGFVSYHGRYRTEKLVTKRVVFSGDELLVNFATTPGGHMFVKVRDEQGKEVRSCELFGDKVDRPVGFDGSLATFAGKPVTLVFELSDADIYSFRFRKRPASAVRPIDAPLLAERAAAYERNLESVGPSNATDAVRIPWLGALNMRYRAVGGRGNLADAQRLFAVQSDAKRPHAGSLTDGPLFVDWMHVADSHFAIAKNPWLVRSIMYMQSDHPLLACYRWKYLHLDRSKAEAARAKLPAAERPDDSSRLADRRAMLGVGAKTMKEVASVLEAKRPSDAEGKARWLWAYWTARQVDK